MNGNDLIEYEERNQELREKFIKQKNKSNLPEMIQSKILDSEEYWEFVAEEYHG